MQLYFKIKITNPGRTGHRFPSAQQRDALRGAAVPAGDGTRPAPHNLTGMAADHTWWRDAPTIRSCHSFVDLKLREPMPYTFTLYL